jgi:hypothetical protein
VAIYEPVDYYYGGADHCICWLSAMLESLYAACQVATFWHGSANAFLPVAQSGIIILGGSQRKY